MTLANPAALAVWLLLIPLVALYLLERSRRAERQVSSVLLFRRAHRVLAASRPHRRLAPYVSLLLQALAVVAGGLALARPSGCGAGPPLPSSAWQIVVLDTSSSMAAPAVLGEPRTRLDAARAAAADLFRSLPEGARGLLVTAGPTPAVRAGPTPDRRALLAALDRVAVEGPASDVEGAVATAAARLDAAPAGSRVVVFGDSPAVRLPLLDRARVEWRPVGAALPNDAIAGVSIAPGDEVDAAALLVRVERRADRGATRWVTVSVVGGGVLASRRVDLPAEGGAAVTLRTPPLSLDAAGRPPFLEVRVSPGEGEAAPAFALDDVAFVAAPGAGDQPVVLVGPVPASVERAVRAAPAVSVFRLAPADLAGLVADPERAPRDALWVLAGTLPAALPPGDVLAVAPRGDAPLGVALRAARGTARVLDWARDDARLRYAGLRGQVWRGVRPVDDPRALALVESDLGPVVVDLPTPTGTTTLVPFDPDAAGWARDPSFVVFVRNAIELARTRRAAGGVPDGALGEPLRVPAVDGEVVEVSTPSGRTLRVEARGALALVAIPPEPGVYEARVAGVTRRVVRHLADASEVDLRPAAARTREAASAGDPATPGDGPRLAAPPSAAGPPRWAAFAALLFAFAVLDLAWAARRAR